MQKNIKGCIWMNIFVALVWGRLLRVGGGADPSLRPDRQARVGGVRRGHQKTEGPVLGRIRSSTLRPAPEKRIFGFVESVPRSVALVDVVRGPGPELVADAEQCHASVWRTGADFWPPKTCWAFQCVDWTMRGIDWRAYISSRWQCWSRMVACFVLHSP